MYKGDLIDKNIKSTIEEEFAKRGIVKKNTEPDFLVSNHTPPKRKSRLPDLIMDIHSTVHMYLVNSCTGGRSVILTVTACLRHIRTWNEP